MQCSNLLVIEDLLMDGLPFLCLMHVVILNVAAGVCSQVVWQMLQIIRRCVVLLYQVPFQYEDYIFRYGDSHYKTKTVLYLEWDLFADRTPSLYQDSSNVALKNFVMELNFMKILACFKNSFTSNLYYNHLFPTQVISTLKCQEILYDLVGLLWWWYQVHTGDT